MAGRSNMRSNFQTGRGLTGKSRTQERIDNKLGVIPGGALGRTKEYRTPELDKLDKYLCSEQYDHLMPWDSGDSATYIPIRRRKPRIIFNFGKLLCDRVASKLIGGHCFPTLKIEDDPDTEQFVTSVIKAGDVRLNALHAAKRMLGLGAHFLRFYVVGGTMRVEHYNAKFCYPKFDEAGLLESMEIKYTYEDPNDIDERGAPKRKWFKMLLTQFSDVMYDNPPVDPHGGEPVFEETERADHDFGFVQGEWFRTTEDKHSPDGESLIGDEGIRGFIDSINYSLSQGDQSVAYAQEPQLVIKGMDVDEIDNLIKSSTKAWNLGRDGEAAFVESTLTGIEKAIELRDKMKANIADLARVVMLDPEKIVGSAQSAKAMEVLHGPLVDLVHELRPVIEKSICSLVTKMAVCVLILQQRGVNEVMEIPKGWAPKSLNITPLWAPIFPMTMEDLQKKVSVAVQAANNTIISRETMLSWVAKDFGIEDLEEEKAKIAAQPVINPFGAF